jgi:hypothetical protein
VGVVEDFIEEFVRDVPGLDGMHEAHLENEGELLAHVFFAIDVVKGTVESYLGEPDYNPDWRRVLSYLEAMPLSLLFR